MNDLIPLSKVQSIIPKRLNHSTIWRWCKQGVKTPNGERVRLAHSKAGGRIVVSRAAVRAFLKATQ